MAGVAPAFRQFGSAMAAAIGKRRRLSLAVQEHDDFLAEERERLWSVREHVDGHGRVPETAKDLLLGAEHETRPPVVIMRAAQSAPLRGASALDLFREWLRRGLGSTSLFGADF